MLERGGREVVAREAERRVGHAAVLDRPIGRALALEQLVVLVLVEIEQRHDPVTGERRDRARDLVQVGVVEYAGPWMITTRPLESVIHRLLWASGSNGALRAAGAVAPVNTSASSTISLRAPCLDIGRPTLASAYVLVRQSRKLASVSPRRSIRARRSGSVKVASSTSRSLV